MSGSADPLGGGRPRQVLVRCCVAIGGAGMLVAATPRAAGVVSTVCTVIAAVLLVGSTALIRRWADGPTVFAVATILAFAVGPRPSLPHAVALTVATAFYLSPTAGHWSSRDS